VPINISKPGVGFDPLKDTQRRQESSAAAATPNPDWSAKLGQAAETAKDIFVEGAKQAGSGMVTVVDALVKLPGAGDKNPRLEGGGERLWRKALGMPDVNAAYQKIEGTPFVQGPDDAAAVDANDVRQGKVGDCYFMAALASVAKQRPDLIENMIRPNEDGTYTVTLYERSLFSGLMPAKVEVKVTPELPVDVATGRLAFAQGGDEVDGKPELWAALIEKAYAQREGSYALVTGGFGGMGLEAISGERSQLHDTGRLTFEDLASTFERQAGIVAHSLPPRLGHKREGDGGLDHPLYKNGTIVASHAYYVAGIDRDSGTVSIRNPWGWDRGEIKLTFEEFQSAFSSVAVNPLAPRDS
jgi:hypothetical protein